MESFIGPVGDNARKLVDKWKRMVKKEEEDEELHQAKAKEREEESGNKQTEDNDSSENSSSDDKPKHRKSSSDSDNASSDNLKRTSKKRRYSESNEDSSSDTSSSSDNSNSAGRSSDTKSVVKPKHRKKSHIKAENKKSEKYSSTSSSNKSQSKEKIKHNRPNKDSGSNKKSNESCKSSSSRSGHSSSSTHKKDEKKSSTVSDKKKDDVREKSKHKESNKSEKTYEKKDNLKKKHEDEPNKNYKKHKLESPSRNKSSSSKEHKKSSSNKKTNLLNGIDSGSGTSFADALGMLEPSKSNKTKKRTETLTTSRSKEESPSSNQVANFLKTPVNLEPLDINISGLLPSITPNYKPISMPLDNFNRRLLSEDETLTRVISAKHQRTKVYSGNKSGYTKVPSLFDLCSRVLQENLDALEYTGGVPYSILKPILERANPNQLYQLEFHNPYLIEDTDELWQLHCQKEFRTKQREEMESWREMYLRCLDEREAKLRALTANIKQSQDNSTPVRQTKLAYVDSVVKPPRNIAKKQAKNGTAIDIKRPSTTPTERLNQLVKAGEAGKVAVPNPGRTAVERGSGSHFSSTSSAKPKKAPLMAKTLSLLKNRFGRR
ncbi:hypothetical protein ABEB36_004838 [Hypothenemus hampei]|uniref:Transcription elongation factor B polypeptide 3 n=2 Tax=Hypothenemus hampei TaxID=57062 RepID=A0ABD1EW11_HYPHA